MKLKIKPEFNGELRRLRRRAIEARKAASSLIVESGKIIADSQRVIQDLEKSRPHHWE